MVSGGGGELASRRKMVSGGGGVGGGGRVARGGGGGVAGGGKGGSGGGGGVAGGGKMVWGGGGRGREPGENGLGRRVVCSRAGGKWSRAAGGVLTSRRKMV